MTPVSRISAAALVAGIAAAGIAAAQDSPPDAPLGGPMGGPMTGGPMAGGPMAGGPMVMMGFGPGRIDVVAIDTDGNGSLSRAELVARASERLAKADANGDGTLTRAELIEALPGPRHGLLDLFGPDPAAAFADRLLALMGATEGGQVTVADLANQRVNFLLAFADTDRDGAVSQAEADSMRDSHRGRMGRHGHGHGMDGMDRGDDADSGPGGQDRG